MASAAPTPDFSAGLMNWQGKLITEGTRLYCQQWGWHHVGVFTHFLWHVERARSGKLVLVADGAKRRLPLTAARLADLAVYTPAPGLGWPDFAEQWGWWKACGWGVALRQVLQMPDEDEPGIDLQAYRGNTWTGMHWDAPSWRLLQQHPGALRRQLGEILFVLQHPRKFRKLGLVLCSDHIPHEVYQAFTREMRRRVAERGVA